MRWYGESARDLPWRRTGDPYAIWISEIMLQQTRVQAVIPYYERFLARFPTAADLAAAPEQDVLAAWSGLGYYSRARNLQKAAKQIVERGGFPSVYDGIRSLAGIGDYTAAAIASIAFGLSHAALDGNVVRVMARVLAESGDAKSPAIRKRLRQAAQDRLDRRDPGGFNQALMELGATVCLPRAPKCLLCPVAGLCEARAIGSVEKYPILGRKQGRKPVKMSLFLGENKAKLLLRQRPETDRRMAGFWEFPESLDGTRGRSLGTFRHSIVNHDYEVEVRHVVVKKAPAGLKWLPVADLDNIPLTTVSKKALRLWRAAKIKK